MEQRKRTVLIVDDEHEALDYLAGLVDQREDLSLVLATTDGELAKSYAEKYHIDIAIVDLDLRTMEGYEIMEVLDKHTQIIVCTASENAGSQTIDNGALEFLNKPFGDNRFDRAVDRAIERLLLLEQQPSAVQSAVAKLPNKDRSAIYPIPWDEIVYIRSHSKMTTVFRKDGRVFQCGYMLRQIEQLMPPYYLRIHRCFLLNMHEIEYYSHRLPDRKVYLKMEYDSFWQSGTDPETKGEGGGKLPVGNTYHERLAIVLDLST